MPNPIEELKRRQDAEREAATAKANTIGSRIWPNTDTQYNNGYVHQPGEQLAGQIVTVDSGYWDSGQRKIDVTVRNEDGDWKVTLDGKLCVPKWDEEPGQTGDWVLFEVLTTKPRPTSPGKFYVNFNMQLVPGDGTVQEPTRGPAAVVAKAQELRANAAATASGGAGTQEKIVVPPEGDDSQFFNTG